MLPVVELALFKPEYFKAHASRALSQGDNVLLLHPGHDHLLLLGNAPNSRNTVAVSGRLFKFQVFRRCLHPFGEQTLRVLSPFGQELQRLFQALVISSWDIRPEQGAQLCLI